VVVVVVVGLKLVLEVVIATLRRRKWPIALSDDC